MGMGFVCSNELNTFKNDSTNDYEMTEIYFIEQLIDELNNK